MDDRQIQLKKWVAETLNQPEISLEMVSGDASFRRYFRTYVNGESLIAMDAPPEKEDSSGFVAIAQYWLKQGIPVPKIYRHDLELGFLLLSDLGDDVLLSSLCPEQPVLAKGDYYYGKAMSILADIQHLAPDQHYPLPPYDMALLQREMALFPDWLLEKKLGLTLDYQVRTMLEESFTLLADSALTQPQVPVHRDYHARNLMVLKDDSLGVIDFQDAVLGPVTYDLVSLLRDCYIVWPEQKVTAWCQQYYQILCAKGQLDCEFSCFKKWFDLMGLQRHLKAAGIFARLSLRDGKHGYLNDIPRTVDYLLRVSGEYPSLKDFHYFVLNSVRPLLNSSLMSGSVT